MMRWNCAALALLAACGSISPEGVHTSIGTSGPERPAIEWQRTLEDAEALAAETSRPLLLALNMDGESASDRIWHENYRDPAFVALTRRCVCVAASVFRHNANDHDALGRRIECPRLSGLTCGEHIALEPQLFAGYFDDGERVAPRHALVQPDGTKAFDLSLCFDLRDIDRALAAATAGVEPWRAPSDRSWTGLAARRDAAGRRALEAAVADCESPAALREAIAGIAERGDRGSLPALRILLERSPDLDALQSAAYRLGLADELRARIREKAQRLGPVLEDPQAPPDFVTLVTASAERDTGLRTRTWLCGLYAEGGDSSIWNVIEWNWGGPDHSLTAGVSGLWRVASELPVELQSPVSIPALLELGERAVTGDTTLPRPGLSTRELATSDSLRERMARLDERLTRRRDDAEALAELGIASLDLGRVELATGGNTAQLLFEDAARYLDRALQGTPDAYDWWIERARTAYYLQRHDQQQRFGAEALARAGYAWPPARDAHPALLQDARAIEALRWIGDAAARQLAGSKLEDPIPTVGLMRSALLGLGLTAVSPFGRGRDFTGFVSFVESLGLVREEMAILIHALMRLPNASEVRNALSASLWLGERWQSLPGLADSALEPTPTADGLWWAGYARLQVAEELRRREQARAAVAHYAVAETRFESSAESNPAYRDSVHYHLALCWLGRGLAHAQGANADRVEAARCLARAVALRGELTGMRDGSGYDALDLVDKVLEWRANGPSPVTAAELLDALLAVAPDTPFWATAISDSALREALRADGRNPVRVVADTVDASGAPIRVPMGLPTELGDRYLAGAITAGAQAVQSDLAGDEDRQVFAQVLTIRAERELVRERVDGVRDLLQRAAALVDLDLDEPPAGVDELEAMRAMAAPLRQRLGPARPRLRAGR